MEISSVMMKKKRIEQGEVEAVLDDIADRVDIFALDTRDQIDAYKQQRETILYTLDCVLMALADDIGAELVTFDTELLEHGCVSPAELL
ncbi:PIN domain-containing protein [Haloarcula onubensis]|uniref:PIN domain-containing protein n=1 Tax=Haloarcula onubensis TaxID=2950539 RepID=A0ABU2FS01_9EURY|nr:PIN domain-containing protein [Halomicroarcula sp. S3CR25-11]